MLELQRCCNPITDNRHSQDIRIRRQQAYLPLPNRLLWSQIAQ